MTAVMTAQSELDKVNYCRELFRLARDKKRDVYPNWQRNYKVVHNKYSFGGSSSNAMPKDSEIFPVLSAIISWMTDQHTNIAISPAADPGSQFVDLWTKIAKDLQTIIQSNWINLDEVQQIKLALWDAFTFGPSYFKTVWDQQLDEGYGNAKFIRCDPWTIYLDPNGTCLADSEFICEVRKMSLSEIERRWPKTSTQVAATSGGGDVPDVKPSLNGSGTDRRPMANPGPLPSGNGRYGAPRGNGPSGNPDSTQAVVYEFWIKENDPYIQNISGEDQTFMDSKWKVIVLCNNQILMEEYAEDLWAYASHPYDEFIPEDFGELYGMPITDHLIQPQIYINRLLGTMQQNADLCGNPVFIEAANSGLDRTPIVNKPGQRLRMSGPAAMQNKPEWLMPPPMPPVIMDLVQFWISRIENISGLGAAIKGGVNGAPSRTPEGVISTIQEAAFVRIRSMLGNLEATLCSIGRKLCDLVIENYNEKRIVAIVGPSGQADAIALKKNHFLVPDVNGGQEETPLKYSLIVQAGASMPTSRQARVAEADQAYALGIIDRQAWFEAHQYPNWPDILTRVNSAITAGIFNPPGARQRAHQQ